jgi:hypothetical protein
MVRLAGSKVEPLPVRTAARSAQSSQSLPLPMAFRDSGGGRRFEWSPDATVPPPHPWCASTAPTSMAAACTPRAWPSCRPVCSAARSAVTGSCPTPRWGWSPPPSGPGSTRPPDRRKCSGKDLERATWTRRSGCWLPVVSYSHGGTTCLPCRQAWGFPAWQDHDRRPPQQRPPGRPESPLVGRPGHPTAVRPPAEGQVWPGSGIQGDHGQAESLR